jgi:NAD(P) transhydrogenase subunit alpha
VHDGRKGFEDAATSAAVWRRGLSALVVGAGRPWRIARCEAARLDYWSMLFVFVLASFIGLGVIRRVSRLLHTPLMSITNAISAIAVVGSILVTGSEYPPTIRFMGGIALFASMTNIVSGFLITDRMLKMFKTQPRKSEGGKR